MRTDIYQSPLCGRYASYEMQNIFSADQKFSMWRKLWVALAESEKELGLPITEEQIEEMKSQIHNIDYEAAKKYELELRHDVMAHVHAYGDACPNAAGIIHLGATSCYVGDNTDIILMHTALKRVRVLLVNAIDALSKFAEQYKSLPTLAYTHFQAAQPTTVGKRACLWLNDLLFDLEQLDFQLDSMRLLGCKGTTGTGASFLELFDGDEKKVELLEQKIAEKIGFSKCQSVSGQTYTRKVDFAVLQVLSGIAQSVSKFSSDIRLLSHLKEVDEPFEEKQIGSSAMAYKRNPMRSERISSLSKFIIAESISPAMVEATQWLERSLDDSANKRLSIPQAFMAADAILEIGINVTDGLVVYESMINKHINEELPFMATENILMEAVKRGGDRQELHEEIRELSMKAAYRVKHEGLNNNLIDLILESDKFDMLKREEISDILDPMKFVGRAPEQVVEFVEEYLNPAIEPFKEFIGGLDVDLKV